MVAGDADVTLTDCIVDAGAPDDVALRGRRCRRAGARADGHALHASIGKVHTRAAAACLEQHLLRALRIRRRRRTAPVIAERRQEGCVRFCFVPPGSITPRRFRCVPDERHPPALPHFTSLRYGDPGYGQLRRVTDAVHSRGRR